MADAQWSPDEPKDRRIPALKKLDGAVNVALRAGGHGGAFLESALHSEEPESEQPSEDEALEAGLAEVQRAVAAKLEELGSSGTCAGGDRSSLSASASTAALLSELLDMLGKTVRLAQVRGQRAQRLDKDLKSARAALVARSALAPTPPASDRDRGGSQEETLDQGTLAQLMTARKTIKEKEWELVEVRRRVDQLERERSRQEQRIRNIETVAHREAWEQDRPSEATPQDAPTPTSKPTSVAEKEPRRFMMSVASDAPAEAMATVPSPPPASLEACAPSTRPTAPAPSASTSSTMPALAEEAEDEDASTEQASCDGKAIPAKMLRTFLVDNRRIQSSAKGVTYRLSKSLHDRDESKLARWGEVVQGYDDGDDWVRVGSRFLPKRMKNVEVLTVQEGVKLEHRLDLAGAQQAVAAPAGASAGANAATGAVGRPPRKSVGSVPMDLRGLGKMLTGNAVQTPRH